MPLFRLTDIYLAYGTQVLLDKVNLTIQPNERWGLLGRNGTGKSTFLKLLNGSIKPDGGELEEMLFAVAAALGGIDEPESAIVADVAFRDDFPGLSAGGRDIVLVAPRIDAIGEFFERK